MIDEKYEVHPEIAKEIPLQVSIEEPEEPTRDELSQVPVRDEMSHTELPQQKDFRELREAKKRMEKENAELRRRNMELESSRQPQLSQPEPEEFIGPNDIAEGKHLYKYDKKMKKQEDQMRQYHQQTMQLLAETRLKTLYPDFDKVVSDENILKLRDSHPELAATLGASGDTYTAGVSAYTMIKKLNISPSEDLYSQDRERVQKNLAKPRSTASISPHQSESPLTQVNAFASGLTEDLKKSLHKEMMDAIKAGR